MALGSEQSKAGVTGLIRSMALQDRNNGKVWQQYKQAITDPGQIAELTALGYTEDEIQQLTDIIYERCYADDAANNRIDPEQGDRFFHSRALFGFANFK